MLYLHGAGEAFCAGADLDEVKALDARRRSVRGAGPARRHALESADRASSPASTARPAAAASNSRSPATSVSPRPRDAGRTGVRLGLFGAWGGTARLPDIVGTGDALDIALSGRTLDAETALQMGLVSRVTAEPRAVAEEIAAVDADALRVLNARMRDDADGRHRSAASAAFADLNAKTE